MKNSKIFLSLYIGYASYTILVFLFGATGILAMSKYEIYKNALIENNRFLEEGIIRLQDERYLLENDREEIRLRSRTLGLYSEAEQVIIIDNNVTPIHPFVQGKPIVFSDTIMDVGPQFRTAGIAISLMVYIMLILFMKEENAAGKKRSGNVF